MLVFVCHPYHRGGVTSWIKEAFHYCQTVGITSKFLTVRPKKDFISGGNRPDMLSYLGLNKNVHSSGVDYQFELGTFNKRVDVYLNMINTYAPKGSTLIPSDDEACFVACIASINSYKVIGVLHSDDPYYYELYNKYKKYLSGVVSVSERIKSNAESSDYFLPHIVIPCGIQLDNFLASKDKKNIIVWIGRVEEDQKRVSDIIPIADNLRKITDNWEIRVFGDGSKLSELKALSEERGLNNHLKFFGWTAFKEIKNNLSNAKILLQTSNYEGMSVAVMEALASGCCIVSSRVSGVEDLAESELAQNLVNLYEIGDTPYAAKLLEKVLNNFSDSLSSNAVILAKKYYSIDSNIYNLTNFSNSLVNKRMSYPLQPFTIFKSIVSTTISVLRRTKYKISN